jgi:hypothetical protein
MSLRGRIRLRLIRVASTALVCGAALVHGQNGPVYLPAQPGVWRPATYENNSPGTAIGKPRASAAELDVLRSALTRIEQAVRDTPMMTAPRGFDVHARQRLDRGCPGDPILCRQAPLAGWIELDIEPYMRVDGKVTTRKAAPPDVWGRHDRTPRERQERELRPERLSARRRAEGNSDLSHSSRRILPPVRRKT